MFHKKVIGIPSQNRDHFFLKEEQLEKIYAENTSEDQISIVEGAMGLFDGLGGILEEGSAYHVAKSLHLPIILIVDAHGMGRSVIPLISGFLQYDHEHLIRGVVLNKVSKSFYKMISKTIEEELDIEMLGCIPQIKNLNIESRHLGLKLPDEINDLKNQLDRAAGIVEEHVNIDRILEIANETKEYEVEENQKENVKKRARVAVARDEAFCFYYEENFKVLEQYGAELVYFSPLHDERIPDDVDGLLLGGGYPELFADQLEVNESMRTSVKKAIENGMPSLAECGGFMYLHEKMTDADGRTFKMCNVIKGSCFYTGKLVRFGYVSLFEKENLWLAGKEIKAHEFHYFDSECNGTSCVAKKPTGKRTWECIHSGQKKFWGFAHLYYRSNENIAIRFIDECENYKKTGKEGK